MAVQKAPSAAGLKPERWAQIERTFHSVLDCEASSRAAFLEEACATDPELRTEVESLLVAERPAQGFVVSLLVDALETLGSSFTRDPDEFQGTHRFIVRRKLGSGGFGIVYEVLDVDRNAVVALKMLNRFGAQELARFKNEFRSLADLYHPNLVTLYELISDGDCWFFTMEFIDGVNFRDYARECGVERLRDLLNQLMDGVRSLHRAGKLHCDLKPSNVLVTPDGRAVILDFGLVTEIETNAFQRDQPAAGTPFYMALDQIDGAPATEAADWYSLGVMLYEALSGRPLFTGGTAEVIAQKRSMEFISPASFGSDVPEDLRALCSGLLQTDPGVQSGELKRGFDTPSLLSPGHLFVGREIELNALRDAFRATQAKEAVVVLVEGNSGIGKTTLVSRFLDGLRENEDAVVLKGRCHERESVPYKALDSLVDNLSEYLSALPMEQCQSALPESASELARLFPALMRVLGEKSRPGENFTEPHALRALAFSAFRELIGRIAESKPVVLFIDDLQWSDVDSGTLLAHLLSPPKPPPVLLIGCCRSEQGTPAGLLHQLRSWQRMRTLVVRELPPNQTLELAGALLGSPGGDHADSVAKASGGNPFLLQRLAAHDSRMLQAGNSLDVDDLVRDVIVRLPQDARRLLEVVSVAARPIEMSVARTAAEVRGDLYGALAPLRAEKLVRISPAAGWHEIEPYHDRIRQGIVQTLCASRMRSHHEALALAWEGSASADCETLAVHFQGAGVLEKAGMYAAQAGDQAATALAFDQAARWYHAALDVSPAGNTSEQLALRVKLADALSNAGRGSEGAGEYLLAADQAVSSQALELRRRAATQYLLSGHLDRGLTVLDRVLGMVKMKLASTPSRALVSLMARRTLVNLRGLRFRERKGEDVPAEDLIRIDACWSVAQGLGFVDAIHAADFHAAHLLHALRAGERFRVARAIAVEAGYSAFRGVRNHRRTQDLIDRAMELSEMSGQPYAVPFVTLISGIAAFLEGRWLAATKLHRRAELLLQKNCAGAAWELATSRIMSGAAVYFMGELADLCNRLPVLLHEADARGDLYEATALRTRLVHITELCRDNPRAAAEQNAAAIAKWPGRGFQTQHWWSLLAESQTILYSEDSSRALELWTRAWPKIRKSGILRLQYIRIETLHERASSALAAASARDAASSDRRQFLKIAETDARRIQSECTPWGQGFAQLIFAGVASCHGRLGQALEFLQTAQTSFEQADMKLFAVVARARRGELVGGEGGGALVESAGTWMTRQNIRRPDRMLAMLAPGIWDS